jgi:hypothetical protein
VSHSPPSLESKSQRFGKKDPNECGMPCKVFYELELMVKIGKNWFEI